MQHLPASHSFPCKSNERRYRVRVAQNRHTPFFCTIRERGTGSVGGRAQGCGHECHAGRGASARGGAGPGGGRLRRARAAGCELRMRSPHEAAVCIAVVSCLFAGLKRPTKFIPHVCAELVPAGTMCDIARSLSCHFLQGLGLTGRTMYAIPFREYEAAPLNAHDASGVRLSRSHLPAR